MFHQVRERFAAFVTFSVFFEFIPYLMHFFLVSFQDKWSTERSVAQITFMIFYSFMYFLDMTIPAQSFCEFFIANATGKDRCNMNWFFMICKIPLCFESSATYFARVICYGFMSNKKMLQVEMKLKNLIHRYCRFLSQIWILEPKTIYPFK